MKKTAFQIAAILLAGLVVALGINRLRHEPVPVVRPSASVLALKAGIVPIHLDTAKLLSQDPKFLFVDARPAVFCKQSHIPRAVCFPEEDFKTLIQGFKDTVKFDRPIVTYCSGEECRASELLAKELQAEGYKYLHTFFGGWTQWQESHERTEP